MLNLKSPGKVMSYIAPAGGVVSGTPVLIGGMLVVPITDADATVEFAAATSGVFEMAKVSGTAAAQGAVAYWNNTTKVFTPTKATGLYKVGSFAKAAQSGDTLADVRLDGVSAVAEA